MKASIAALMLLASLMLTCADQLVESVQQALKDQGFYYGEINGEKNANLSAAIRRYQIRNGLQVTGELNPETLQSLGINSSGSTVTQKKPASPAPGVSSSPGEESADVGANATPAPQSEPFENPPENQQVYPSTPLPPNASLPPAGVFAGTPFEFAPPGVQRDIVIAAQIALARRDLYHDKITGVYGREMEFSLRAYQSRTGLPVNGRLDLETLAALRLLPGPRHPFYDPSRRRMRRPPAPPIPDDRVPE